MYVLRVNRLISTKKFISSGLDVKFLHIQYIHDYDEISKTNISTFRLQFPWECKNKETVMSESTYFWLHIHSGILNVLLTTMAAIFHQYLHWHLSL